MLRCVSEATQLHQGAPECRNARAGQQVRSCVVLVPFAETFRGRGQRGAAQV